MSSCKLIPCLYSSKHVETVELKCLLLQITFAIFAAFSLACEQALWGVLVAGWEKERELATTSLEFEYLHRKSLCEMLIVGDDISNDIIAQGTCFPMFVYICACFHFAVIGGNLTAQLSGSHRGIGG